MKYHMLDNPIWNALVTKNGPLSLGSEWIKYFPEDIAPFAGLKEVNPFYLDLLYQIISPGRIIVLITSAELNISDSWQMIRQGILLQMVMESTGAAPVPDGDIVPLQNKHVPRMLELTRLTNPGPFSRRTIEFGNYAGIFQAGELVAMAGQRLHLPQYAEISAVCTHPDHTGRGYGSRLLLYQAQRMIRRGDTPFLHVRSDNENAIKLYKTLGFGTRREMNLAVIQKSK